MGHKIDIISVSGKKTWEKHRGRPRQNCEEFILGLIFCLFGEVAECTNYLKTLHIYNSDFHWFHGYPHSMRLL
jgi:hypothetical protein